MPWQPSDAPAHTKKADTPVKQKLWAEVANRQLKKHGDEARAIRVANSIVGRGRRKI